MMKIDTVSTFVFLGIFVFQINNGEINSFNLVLDMKNIEEFNEIYLTLSFNNWQMNREFNDIVRKLKLFDLNFAYNKNAMLEKNVTFEKYVGCYEQARIESKNFFYSIIMPVKKCIWYLEKNLDKTMLNYKLVEKFTKMLTFKLSKCSLPLANNSNNCDEKIKIFHYFTRQLEDNFLIYKNESLIARKNYEKCVEPLAMIFQHEVIIKKNMDNCINNSTQIVIDKNLQVNGSLEAYLEEILVQPTADYLEYNILEQKNNNDKELHLPEFEYGSPIRALADTITSLKKYICLFNASFTIQSISLDTINHDMICFSNNSLSLKPEFVYVQTIEDIAMKINSTKNECLITDEQNCSNFYLNVVDKYYKKYEDLNGKLINISNIANQQYDECHSRKFTDSVNKFIEMKMITMNCLKNITIQ